VHQPACRHFDLTIVLGQQAETQFLDFNDNSTVYFSTVDKFNNMAWFHLHLLTTHPLKVNSACWRYG
jgi:hypothetical protein